MDQVHDSITTSRPKRTRKAPARFDDMVAYALPVECVEGSVPETFREAELSSESEKWMEAMSEEMGSLHKNNT